MEQNALTPEELMNDFADTTGLSLGAAPPRRYLWTDAFAVCNFLGLFSATEDARYKRLALRLVDQVHHKLGRRRSDDPQPGWISGLSEEEGEKHPTAGGLRIGKKLKERGPTEPYDERVEWDRDGQYFHYLTKWMHALNLATRAFGDPIFNTWAVELAKTAHSHFTYAPRPGAQKRMYWKMSVDLTYPLVPSMGHHDPLDGLITYYQLQDTATRVEDEPGQPDLSEEIADMARICQGKDWATDDPLGLGGLLTDALRVARLAAGGVPALAPLLETLLDGALLGFQSFKRQNLLTLPAEYRLAFRELGLSIGLKAAQRLERSICRRPASFPQKKILDLQTKRLLEYTNLAETIESFWLAPENRQGPTWIEHREINMVMLATSLAPEGFLAF